MKIIQAHLMGVNATHSQEFKIDFPKDPYGTNLVFTFRSPGMILTRQGIERAEIGNCIIHSTDFRIYHYAVDDAVEGYRNDWIHVSPPILEPIIKRLRLPFNQLIPTGQPEILTPFIQDMQDELLNIDEFSEKIISNKLEGMLLTIAKYRKKFSLSRERMSKVEQHYYPKFLNVRKKMLDNCCQETNVKQLAKQVNLSPDRFAVLYRDFFNSTPYAEVINHRLIKAKRLLLSTSMEIKEIAVECGWDNIHYFSRIFKKRLGIAPSQYREQTIPQFNRKNRN